MTRRKEIIELWKVPAPDLAYKYKVELKEILQDLQHIAKTIYPKLKIIPARCEKCGVILKERKKFNKPSKCPKCKSEWIKEAVFYVKNHQVFDHTKNL